MTQSSPLRRANKENKEMDQSGLTREMVSAADALDELMRQYDRNRAQWIDDNGTADGFDEWFTGQVLRPMENYSEATKRGL